MSNHRSLWSIPLIYLVLSISFFVPSMYRRQVPLPLENAYTFADPLWKQVSPQQLSGPANYTLVDLTNYYYPYMKVVVPRLLNGDLPLWNPLIYSGMPLMAAHQPAVLYPLTILFAPLGPDWIWLGTGIARLFLMGYGMHLLMRRLGVSHTAALWSGVTYALCGSSIAWLHFVIHNVLAFLPLALYSVDRLLEAPRGRWFLLLTATLVFQFFGGHPETSVLFALVWGSFTLVDLYRWRVSLRTLGILGLSVVAALALSLPQLLPTLELIRDSQTYQRRLQELAEPTTVGALNWANLKHSLLAVNPYLYGSPLGNRYLTNSWNYNEMITYMGVLTVPLILAGVIGGRPRLFTVYWALVALVSFGLTYQFPVILWLRALPVLDVGAGVRFLLSWSIAAAALAGFGVDWVLRAQRRAQIVVGLAGVLVVVLLGASILDAVQAAQGSWFFGTLGPIALRKIADFYNRNNPQILGLLAVAGLGAMLWIGLALSIHRTALRQTIMLGLLAVTVVDLLFHGVPYNSFAAPEAIYPVVPVTKVLQQGVPPSRFITLDRIMYGNTSMTQGIHNVLGEEDVIAFRYTAFASRSSKIGMQDNTYEILPLAQRFFDIANVEYVVTSKQLTGLTPAGPWRLHTQDGGIRVYRNPNVLPRAYVVSQVRFVAADEAISAVYEPTFDPTRQAIVEEPISELTQQSASQGFGTANITSYEAERIVIETTMQQAGLLVLSDSYAPGWKATIDGKPTRLYRANAVYRGVVVPAGTHRIEMAYRPFYAELGFVVAGITLVLCGLGVAWNRQRRLSRSRT